MENSGGEQRVDHVADASASPPALLDLLITRLSEPAAVLDESLTVVAANDAFGTLGAGDGTLVGESLPTVVPDLNEDTVEGMLDTADEYAAVRTGEGRWTEFGFDRHGSHILCIGRAVSPDRAAGDAGERTTLDGAVVDLQTTWELLAAEDREAVADRIVETATEVLGLSGATLYLFDACRNVLWPAGVAGASGSDARATVGGDDDSVVREVFLAGESTTLDGGDRYQPLGEYGVLHTVGGSSRAPDRDESTGTGDRRRGEERAAATVDRLAGSAGAALERLDRESRLRERDERHREQRERIATLERTLSVVRRVHRVLADADTVADIEERVPAALTEASWLSFAWVGRATADGVEPRTWSGTGSDYLEAVSLSTDDPEAPPAARTAASGQVTTVDAVAEAIRERHWRRAAIARDFQAAVSVPLRVGGVGYGVLTAHANQPVAWDDSLRAVFAELGTSVAAAIRDRQRRSRLAADTGVELDLTVDAPDAPLGRLAATLEGTLCCTDVIPVDGARTRVFLTVPGAEGAAVADAVDAVEHADSLAAVGDGDRYELLVHEPTVVGRVVRDGARLDTACVSDGELALTVTLAADADVRAFVDRLGDGCADVRLTARRSQPTATRSRGGLREALEAALTDRQLEALRTAYGSGFFEWPRETTGQGVAEMLGVAQPTANRHLRVSQRKLLELVFDDG